MSLGWAVMTNFPYCHENWWQFLQISLDIKYMYVEMALKDVLYL